MPRITKEQLAEVRSTHGQDCKRITMPAFPGHDFVAKPCTPTEFDAMAVALASRDPSTAANAPRQLAADLIVWPGEDVFRDFAEQYPGAAHTLGQKLAEMAGVGVDVIVGKD